MGESARPRRLGGGGVCRGLLAIAAALFLALLMWCPQPAQAASFRDVPSGEWYATWVKQASDKGLMSGFTDASGRPTGYFGPDEPLTRAQVATVLWRMAGSPSSGHASFPDVVKGSWYDQAVAWCVRAGVVTGYTSGADKGCFRPDRPVSRQELATMAYRYAKHAGMDTSNPDPSSFKATTDWRSVDSWAVEALTWTSAAGVLSGVDDRDGTRSIQPFGTATRAMAAKVFVVLSGSPVPAKASVTVAFDSNGGSAVKAQSVKPGSKASKPANPTRAGHTFKGWYSDKALTKAYDFNSAVKANLTLYAKWDANRYTVTFDPNGGSSVAKQTVSYGSKASKPANPTRAGHTFKGWYTDKALTKAYDFNSAVKSNLTLYAKWDINRYTVTFDSNGGSSVAKQTVSYGSEASKPANPTKTGYTFKGWYTDKALTKAYDFNSAVKSNLTLYAKWEKSGNTGTYTVTFDSNGGSSVKSQTVKAGSAAVEPTAPARPHYIFKGWRKDYAAGEYTASSKGIGGDVPVTVTIKAGKISDVTVGDNKETPGIGSKAIDRLPGEIVEAGGTDGIDVVAGATVTSKAILTAVDDCLAQSSGGEIYDFNAPIESNLTLHAMWSSVKHTVAFDSNGGSTVESQEIAYGKKVEKPSDPSKADCDFAGWYIDEALAKVYDFDSPVVSDLTLHAKWVAKPYAILYKDGLLSLQRGDVPDSSHGDVIASWPWDGSSRPWYDKRARVRSVVVGEGVVAKGWCDWLFCNLVNCRTMDLGNLDVSDVSNCSYMFFGCSSLVSLDLSSWDVSGATDLKRMFSDCSSLASLDVSSWDVSNSADLSYMFCGCSSLELLDLSSWDVSNAADLSYMFDGCSSLQSLDVSTWDVSNAADLSRLFFGCSSLQSLDVSSWDVSNAAGLSSLFYRCSSLASLNVSGWDVSSATNLSSMFGGCSALTSLDLSGWDVSNAKDFSYMFSDCSSLRSLDLSGWDTSNAEDCDWLFGNSQSISSMKVGPAFTLGSEMPSGPWYDAAGKSYETFPNNVAGTFTRNVASQTLEVGEEPVVEASAAVPAAPEGLLYTVVPEGSSYEPGVEYAELGGRYVGPGAYVTGYEGESGSLMLPLAVEGAPVVSANLSWNDSDRAGLTRLSSLGFERSDDAPSSLVQLDVTGDNLASLDLTGLDALVRLSCAGNPIADLSQLQAWAAVEGREAVLPEQPAAEEPATQSGPEQPVDGIGQPSEEPAQPEQPSESSEEPQEPATPEDPSADQGESPSADAGADGAGSSEPDAGPSEPEASSSEELDAFAPAEDATASVEAEAFEVPATESVFASVEGEAPVFLGALAA